MSSNEISKILRHLPVAANSDLMRYGIEVVEITAIECVELTPLPDEAAEPVALDGCEVIELDTEVVFCDFPVDRNWAEVVPCRPQYRKGTRHENVAR